MKFSKKASNMLVDLARKFMYRIILGKVGFWETTEPYKNVGHTIFNRTNAFT
jgi:hypothetical protein